jgi:hypothetical protein
MAKFNTGQSFADGDQVTGAKLNNIVGLLDIYSGLIADQTAIAATVSTADLLLIADTDAGSSGAANKVTIQKLLNDTLTGGTFTNANISEALSYGTATGTRLVSANATITTGTITTGVIPTFTSSTATFGTTTSTAATITSGTVQTLTAGTANISQGSAILTQGTISTLNSTLGTIATLNSTTGTIATLNSTTGTIATLNSTTGTIPTLVATTLVTIGTGTSAAPAIVPTGDTNTGIFFPAADTLAATTNGTERLRIAPDGQIGIGGENYGTSGQVLTSNGTSSAPSWQLVSAITRGTAVASTSGTAIDFTGIPSGVSRITVILNGVSTSGASAVQIQIGAGSITSSGYVGYATRFGTVPSNVYTSMSSGFVLSDGMASTTTRYGIFVIQNISSDNWNLSGSNTNSSAAGDTTLVNGAVSLSGTLDRVRLTTVGGTETFDAGLFNITYEG